MMFLKFFIAALLATCVSASPMQRRQQEARVITTCTKPNTVALTFVSLLPFDENKLFQ